MSTFGATFGHDGRTFDEHKIYRMPGLTLDTMLASGMIFESPSLIKIDVDGIEHLILSGARSTLRAPTLRSVLVEVNDDFRELASEISQHLTDAGFQMKRSATQLCSTLARTRPASTKFGCEPNFVSRPNDIHSQLGL